MKNVIIDEKYSWFEPTDEEIAETRNEVLARMVRLAEGRPTSLKMDLKHMTDGTATFSVKVAIEKKRKPLTPRQELVLSRIVIAVAWILAIGVSTYFFLLKE